MSNTLSIGDTVKLSISSSAPISVSRSKLYVVHNIRYNANNTCLIALSHNGVVNTSMNEHMLWYKADRFSLVKKAAIKEEPKAIPDKWLYPIGSVVECITGDNFHNVPHLLTKDILYKVVDYSYPLVKVDYCNDPTWHSVTRFKKVTHTTDVSGIKTSPIDDLYYLLDKDFEVIRKAPYATIIKGTLSDMEAMAERMSLRNPGRDYYVAKLAVVSKFTTKVTKSCVKESYK